MLFAIVSVDSVEAAVSTPQVAVVSPAPPTSLCVASLLVSLLVSSQWFGGDLESVSVSASGQNKKSDTDVRLPLEM